MRYSLALGAIYVVGDGVQDDLDVLVADGLLTDVFSYESPAGESVALGDVVGAGSSREVRADCTEFAPGIAVGYETSGISLLAVAIAATDVSCTKSLLLRTRFSRRG